MNAKLFNDLSFRPSSNDDDEEWTIIKWVEIAFVRKILLYTLIDASSHKITQKPEHIDQVHFNLIFARSDTTI